MIQTGFESRVKIHDIISNQLPEFILDESPKAASFLKQYYISQEFQSGPIDIAENLDQYLKLDNLTPEVIVGSTGLTSSISSSAGIVTVTSTKGFPEKYGLLKINDEIITYTGVTTNTFTGCIRGFSGVTNYHKELNSEELVFSTSEASSHVGLSTVENLSALFLQEFYKKLKYTLTPGLENLNFVSDLNVGNFIKEARTLYETKGSDESFKILFNILFGETPKVIDLEQFLLKPSTASYVRRKVVIVEAISGNPLNLSGQTIYKKNDDQRTSASVSEVETIVRKNKIYYKLLLFLGYDDAFPTITGTFDITGSTRNLDYVSVGSSVITVDSTIGFSQSGKIYSGTNEITYADKSINQFFGCQGIQSGISTASVIYGENTYYGYDNGDTSKEVEFRITGSLSGYEQITKNTTIEVGEKILVKNIGEVIKNPISNKTYKEIFANSWIYNSSSRYEIQQITGASQFQVKSIIDKSSLKVGDYIDIISRNSNSVVKSNLLVTNITNGTQVTVNSSISNLNTSFNYDIRRKIKYASSSTIPLEVNKIVSDIQNVYNENDDHMYVASNSLPSYTVNTPIFSYNVSGVKDKNETTQLYSILKFNSNISFKTGQEIYYKPSATPISGLIEGLYFVEKISSTTIKLYISRNLIGTVNYSTFGELTQGIHNFTLNIQKEKILSAQKILRKFPLDPNISDGNSETTRSGSVGILVNGVEIVNYKSDDKIYYGPLQSANVLSGGKEYDVINPPRLVISEGEALLQPILSGSIENVYIVPQDFNINTIISIGLTGGNGSGASFEPVIERKRRELIFNASLIDEGGGVDTNVDTITFLSNHGLSNGDPITYVSTAATALGIGNFRGNNFDTGQYLENETNYYTKYVNDKTIELYPTFTDYISGINTIGFTTTGTSGLQKFVTSVKNTLTGIKVLNGGYEYSNRKLRVAPTGISTENGTITFTNHGFNSGELIIYRYEDTQIVGLTTSNQYYIIKVDDDSFKLADAGIGGTYFNNYERGKIVNLTSVGVGTHVFNYPEISLKVQYSSVGFGTTQSKTEIEAIPVVRGQIIDTYVYYGGSGYGSAILNNHSKPKIKVLTGKEAQLTPIVVDGKIVRVSIQYGGVEYYSTPNLKINGTGKGAILYPVVVNNRISRVIIINSGSDYSSTNTSITVEPTGKNAIFDPQVRPLTINNNFLYDISDDTSSIASEIISSSYNNLQYAISSYSQSLQTIFGDSSSSSPTSHSPIIGWAYDGNPIYGSNGYSSPSSTQNLKRMTSGYTLTNNVNDRPDGFLNGFFIEDYEFTNSGDLDEYNGRFCITPEFPNGTYAYFATVINDVNFNNNIIGRFPYFIGNKYRSKFIEDNKNLDQSFDFNNSNLVRNTFPYKVSEKYAGNEFIIESNRLGNQFSIIESLTKTSIDNFEIVNAGDNYKVGDSLEFNEDESSGGGLVSQVSEIEGNDIQILQTSIITYDNAIFTWENGENIKIKIEPRHDFKNLDYINVSGFSSELSTFNGFYQIGVTTYSSALLSDVSNFSTSGIVTDIYIANIPNDVSIGSSIVVEDETFRVLNIFKPNNVIRVFRASTGSTHTASKTVYFIPDSFTINKSSDYFSSKANDIVYFNPKQSIGIGTSIGVGVGVTYTIGSQNRVVSIPTQTLYIPNHPFKTNQAITFNKLTSSLAISVANTSGSPNFNLPSSGNSQTVYVIKKSVDHIGIVTQVGLTSTTNGLFFKTNGSNDYNYFLKSNDNKSISTVKKILTTIFTDSNHNLQNGDSINLFVKPNLSVGIGTSISVKIKYNSSQNKLLVNQRQFVSSGINTTNNTITIPNHQFKTGDKVLYTATSVANGLQNGYYYIFKLDDNTFNLCETIKDSSTNPPLVVDILSSSSTGNQLSLINPEINSIKNNNLIFDVSDSSLSGYNFKLFYDNEFKDEFVSTAKTSGFTITRSGTLGSSNAKVTVNCNNDIDFPLYYALEQSGNIVSADKEIRQYSKINFINSYYNGIYKISGIGSTSFNISLRKNPENNFYNKNDCDVLNYTTSSTTAAGAISKIRIISPGSNFDKLLSLKKINSVDGNGASIFAISNNIGKIKEFRIVNEGFEYSSDQTLRPEASIPKSLVLNDVNEIKSVKVIYGGKNYINPPNLIIANSSTGKKINSGKLIAYMQSGSAISQTNNLQSGSIRSVSLVDIPKGLPERTVNIVATNNTNGVGIKSSQSSSSGIVTCTLVTPLFGFAVEPFKIGDKIFVEGVKKSGNNGDGVNSENYGYKFFTVTNYQNAGSSLPRKLEYNISGLTTNPGITSTIQDYSATIVNFNNYPKFEVTEDISNFINGETLEINTIVGFVKEDIQLVSQNENNIKVSGFYNLQKNETIRGSESGSLAKINSINESLGRFTVSYGSTQRIGWNDDIGKLDEDFQVIADNDYYQNLSYSIKSKQTWEDIVTPVNNIIHISGLKNFSDTEIINNTKTGINSENYTITIRDITDLLRVDTINNFDLTLDTEVNQNISRGLKFKTKRLTDYIECRTNRVLEIDDISSQFFTPLLNGTTTAKIVGISSLRKYEKYLIQICNKNLTEFQLVELIVLLDGNDIFTLEKAAISNVDYSIGQIYAERDEYDESFYLKFFPTDPYGKTYNIKYLNTTFENITGVGTTSIGFVDLKGLSSPVSVGSTLTIIEKNVSSLESLYSEIHIKNDTTGEMNYVEFYTSHDQNDTYTSEFFFNTTDDYSSNFIGTFFTSITSGVFKLQYKNTSTNAVTLKSRNVGFGSTAVGVGTYRFKLGDQLDGEEKTVDYNSNYSIVSTASTILSFDKTLFTSTKSLIKVGIGTTSALHQVMTIVDSNNIYTLQYPFLSIQNTSGIGTFGGEISGLTASLIFYPDPEFSGKFEILSFNQLFYTEYDSFNIPPSLTYDNIVETVGLSTYYGINDEDNGRKNFTLKHKDIPIFMKKFNPSDASVVLIDDNKFFIRNHFFNTGEELIYRPKSRISSIPAVAIGIGTTLNNVGVNTNILPSTVYAIRIDNDTFRLATRKEYATVTSSNYVTITSTGSGTIHELEMVKKNEKSIISINNIIQSPIAYASLVYNVNNGPISSSSTIFGISGIGSIRNNDILKIDNEYLKVLNVGFGTTSSGPISSAGTFPLVYVQRAVLGSIGTSHSYLSNVKIYRGSFNIINSDIYFTDAPKAIVNAESITKYNLPNFKSQFNGRTFLRKDYTTNQVYDDLSDKFTGIGQTYILTVNGINTVGSGISNGSGIVLINGIFQSPTTENNVDFNYSTLEDSVSGITSIVFSGNTSSFISTTDVNIGQVPRGGIIISLGSTAGLGYAPLVGASVTAIIGAGGSITKIIPSMIGIGTTVGGWGSGYRSPVSVAVTESGHSGTAATITAIVGAGGTLSFVVVNGGSGYVDPTINIPSPSYNNLEVVGVSRIGIGTTTKCGTGLLLNVDVGSLSTTGIGSTLFEIRNFKIVRNGYSFKKGDVIKPIGLVTAYGLSQPVSEFKLTIIDIFNDPFSSWQFGQLDYIDSIKTYQDGFRTRFSLYYNSQLLSFEQNNSDPESQLIDFNSLLLIFINGVLQQPGFSYQFDGGTSFTFSEPPKEGDDVSIFFYRGSVNDSSLRNIFETIKTGDTVQVLSNNNNNEKITTSNLLGITTTQERRLITGITSSSNVKTNLYDLQGIDEINYKPLYWTKQKVDKIIDGEFISKARDSIEPQIYPTSKIIKNITSSDTEIFVDNAQFFNYENNLSIDVDAIIFKDITDPVSATVTAVVSAAGTIQSISIVNSGSGYVGATTSIKIAPPKVKSATGIAYTGNYGIITGANVTYGGYKYSSAPTVRFTSPPNLGAGIGTVATGIANISNGIVTSVTITNPGYGYINPPDVIFSTPGINTSTATATITNGQISSISITNAGFAYTNSNPPQIIISSPKLSYENITKIDTIEGFSGNIVGIGTTVGIGTNLAVKFTLDPILAPFTGLTTGYYVYVFDTFVGSGVTSIINNNSNVIGIGTTFFDNIYRIAAFNSSIGIVTCNILSSTNTVGIATTGSAVGKLSWGRFSGFTRSSSPISIAVSSYRINSGLSTFPTIQRRGYGLRDNGSIKKII